MDTISGVAEQEHLENPAIADRLESFATLLDLAGAGYYTARAYRRPEERPRRGLLLNRAWELVGRVAGALGGEPAGDPRRFRDASEHLAVVCAAADPRSVVKRFEKLPEIVAVVERGDRRALGVTVEG